MRSRSSVGARVIASVMLGLLGAGCARSSRSPEPGVSPSPEQDVVVEGRKIFHGQGLCFACHGGQLQGGPIAPPLNRNWRSDDDTSFAFIVHTVRAGSPHTPMVAAQGGIDAAQQLQVATYVWAVSHGKAVP